MAEHGPLSVTHPQKLKLAQVQEYHNFNTNPSFAAADSWMWNSNFKQDDDSWEVRAFEEDTNHAMGTTWPPRSYTCTFCRREFRSAQALGGHMNVHRRDRARLHQTPPTSTAPSTHVMPTQEFIATNGGLCFLYSLQNPNGGGLGMESHSPILSISPYGPYAPNNLMTSLTPSLDYPVAPLSMNSTLSHSSNNEPSASIDNGGSVVEEIDLQLRLGRSSSSS
ncbi:hypothetical protein RHMOL_Rhmol11G0004400 [Rhododendron molle]|uniref:Uncharacterized protein n=1 Tax=Rhododendron molle TaxID=49168 RepID=A0ACC0LNC5_RHOML|nr:hypothetical protein RHMOL_Rhmol11G0004400 [Rhododendron molle]